MRDHIKRVLGFALIPLLTMASTVLVLPLISSRFGPDGWSAVGLGQSLGAFLSVIAGLAWQVVGAQQVASSGTEQRSVIYAESLKSRGFMFVLLLLPAALLCLVLAPAHKWECVVFMVGTGLNCLNASWFFAGTGQPRYVIRNEGMVRLFGYIASIPAIMLTDSLWSYAVILIITGLIMATANARSIFALSSRQVWALTRSTRTIIREHLQGMVSRGFSAGQQYLGITMVSIFMPQGLPVFTALDNMQKSVNNATSFYPQAFAWWVGSPNVMGDRNKRVRVITWVSIGMGVGVFAGWILAGPFLVRILFQGEAEVGFDLHCWAAMGMATFTTSRALGQLSLVPLGLQSAVYRGVTVCAVVGLPALIVGLWFGGVAGALAASGVSYGGLCVFYLFAIAAGLTDRDPVDAGRNGRRKASKREKKVR